MGTSAPTRLFLGAAPEVPNSRINAIRSYRNRENSRSPTRSLSRQSGLQTGRDETDVKVLDSGREDGEISPDEESLHSDGTQPYKKKKKRDKTTTKNLRQKRTRRLRIT